MSKIFAIFTTLMAASAMANPYYSAGTANVGSRMYAPQVPGMPMAMTGEQQPMMQGGMAGMVGGDTFNCNNQRQMVRRVDQQGRSMGADGVPMMHGDPRFQ